MHTHPARPLSLLAAGALTASFVAPASAQLVGRDGGVVVANRGAGSISVIDAGTLGVTHVALPAAANTPEPMYVTYSAIHDLVFVGDRANNRVVAFNAADYSVNSIIPTGSGVFHMWSDDRRGQLWVNNDISNDVTVIDLASLSVSATFDVPADLVALGGKPHDVILDPNTSRGYVSLIGVNDPASPGSDYVVSFDGGTYAETARRAVGGDPHLSLSATNDLLFVPTQDTDQVSVLDRSTLAPVAGSPIDVPNAHGATMRADGSVFYTTNISDGGTAALYAIDTATLQTVASGPDDTGFGVPHNLALSADESLLFVTHSGATSTAISIFDVSNPFDPVLLTTVDAQANPFGIATVPAIPSPGIGAFAIGAAAAAARRRR